MRCSSATCSPGISATRLDARLLRRSTASAVMQGCDGARTWRISSGRATRATLYVLRPVATHRTGRFNSSTVGVAQLVELLVVVQAVGGSSPLAHPS